jgi:hypothetical protein
MLSKNRLESFLQKGGGTDTIKLAKIAWLRFRWYIFEPKIPIWVKLGGSCNGIWSTYFKDIWYILWQFGIFCGILVYFVAIWYIFPVLVCCTKKNLAVLLRSTYGVRQIQAKSVIEKNAILSLHCLPFLESVQ